MPVVDPNIEASRSQAAYQQLTVHEDDVRVSAASAGAGRERSAQ